MNLVTFLAGKLKSVNLGNVSLGIAIVLHNVIMIFSYIFLYISEVSLVGISSIKVEPYPIHGSFLKLKYLKTELNVDNGTYAIVKVTSHSCRIMVNLSISDYFEVLCNTLKGHIWMCFVFRHNVKTYPLLENESIPYDHSCLW